MRDDCWRSLWEPQVRIVSTPNGTIQNFIEESSSLRPRATLNIVPVAPLFIKTHCLWTDNVGRGTCCYVTVGNDNWTLSVSHYDGVLFRLQMGCKWSLRWNVSLDTPWGWPADSSTHEEWCLHLLMSIISNLWWVEGCPSHPGSHCVLYVSPQIARQQQQLLPQHQKLNLLPHQIQVRQQIFNMFLL